MNIPETMPKNFCIAPFQSIRQNAYGRNSPCAFGAGEWDHGNLTALERWHSDELNQLRQEFIDGKRPSACHRCWNEEDAGKESLRQRQMQYFPNDYEELIKTGLWEQGPKTAVFKTSNVCNLACRSCGGYDSNSYAPEGRYYAEKYNTITVVNGVEKNSNRFIPRLPPKHMDFMQYTDIADNLEKIDFYGGEPLLNTSQLDLLEYLTERGLSKKISLFYTTNITNEPTPRLQRAWSKFKRLEIACSVDGIEDKFEYMRWPGKWNQAQNVLNKILNLKNTLDCEFFAMGSLTISAINCWDSDNIYQWHKATIGDVYINIVESPNYLAVHVLPDNVKHALRQHVKNAEVLGYLDLKQHDSKKFEEFVVWMKRQDEYRKQSFAQVYPEYFKLFDDYWNTVDINTDIRTIINH